MKKFKIPNCAFTEKRQKSFYEKVSLPDDNGCMIWLASASKTPWGDYGSIGVGGIRDGLDKRYSVKAHRYSYALFIGFKNTDNYIDHICHNTLCVAPLHLRETTNSENGQNRAGLVSNNSSGYPRVHWAKHANKWRVVGKDKDGKSIHLGYFSDLDEAKKVSREYGVNLYTHNDKEREGTLDV